jgi:lipoyl synthase
MSERPLRVRWLGRVQYADALALQHGLFRHGSDDHLLLLEHPHVYTLGVRARPEHVLQDPAEVGAELVRVDRGGDVTYHGPGQLVGYPIVNVPLGPGAIPAYVHRVEDLIIGTLADLGLSNTGRLEGFPGVWVDAEGANPRKICAIGVRVSRGRSMHGFALNVEPDLSMFDRIVPCGIAEHPVTSLAAEGIDVSMDTVLDAVIARAALVFAAGGAPRVIERQDASSASHLPPNLVDSNLRSLDRRLAAAGVAPGSGIRLGERKPEWLRVQANMGPDYLALRKTMHSLDLVTVCEEAGCPNIHECWNDGTATFMVLGERCTRNCSFCLVDTRHPLPPDPAEPARVADAVHQMQLAHAVVTMVARDDLPDGGAGIVAETIRQIHGRNPGTTVEVLISDHKGDPASLQTIFDAHPDVLNHNLETTLRLQRAVRTSATYARSLAVLARAKAAGLVTKSGMMLGLGETDDEVIGALRDLSAIGVDILTLGQYLRPTERHLPVARFVPPAEFAELGEIAREMGFAHVESSPLARSSYHARQAVEQASGVRASA